MVVVARRLPHGSSWMTSPDKSVRLVVFPIRHVIVGPSDFNSFEKEGDFGLWSEPAESGFLVLASRQEAALVEKLRQCPRRFEDYVDIMRGIETYHPSPANGLRRPRAALTGDIYRYQMLDGTKAFIDYTPEIEKSKPWRFFSGPRILLRQLLSRKFRLQAVLVERPFLTNQSVQSLILRHKDSVSLQLLLGILNSRLLSWFFCQINMVARRDDFPKTIIKQTRELPTPELRQARTKAIESKIETLVTRILSAKQKNAEEETAAMEQDLDQHVYNLYGLTEDEIDLVQKSSIPR